MVRNTEHRRSETDNDSKAGWENTHEKSEPVGARGLMPTEPKVDVDRLTKGRKRGRNAIVEVSALFTEPFRFLSS